MKCRGNWAAEVMSFLLIPRLFFYFSHVAVHFIPVVIQFFFRSRWWPGLYSKGLMLDLSIPIPPVSSTITAQPTVVWTDTVSWSPLIMEILFFFR